METPAKGTQGRERLLKLSPPWSSGCEKPLGCRKQDRAPGKKRDERTWRKPQDVQGLSPTGVEVGGSTTQGTWCGGKWLPAAVAAAPLLALWHSWISCSGTLPNWAIVSAHARQSTRHWCCTRSTLEQLVRRLQGWRFYCWESGRADAQQYHAWLGRQGGQDRDLAWCSSIPGGPQCARKGQTQQGHRLVSGSRYRGPGTANLAATASLGSHVQ